MARTLDTWVFTVGTDRNSPFPVYLIAAGISGTIDHLWRQPLMGAVLNAFNRFVLPRLDVLTGYEIYANLSLSVIGLVVVVIAERMPRS